MRLRPLKYRELIAKLIKLNLFGPFPGGRHPYFLLADKKRITIPNFHKKDIPVKILKIIIKQLRISDEEFLEL